MAGELLGKFVMQKLAEKKPEIIQQQEIIQKIITKNPFLMSEQIFADIMPTVESNKFYAISYVGSQGHGKSFSAAGFATLAQQIGYLVIYGKAEDLLPDLNGWVAKVKELIRLHGTPKVCFVLDDMSYSTGTISSKAASNFKNFVADIRHRFEGVFGTIQIFIIYISHRYHSVPPMLRNSATWVFASMQPEDRSDAMKLIPNQKEQKDKLEAIYVFLSKVTQDGPKFPMLKFSFGGSDFNFKWGRKEDPGDGRLMMSFHRGELRIFNAKKIENMIDLEKYRILYVPPKPKTEEEILEEKARKAEAFKLKALEMTEKLNKNARKDDLENNQESKEEPES